MLQYTKPFASFNHFPALSISVTTIHSARWDYRFEVCSEQRIGWLVIQMWQ